MICEPGKETEDLGARQPCSESRVEDWFTTIILKYDNYNKKQKGEMLWVFMNIYNTMIKHTPHLDYGGCILKGCICHWEPHQQLLALQCKEKRLT